MTFQKKIQSLTPKQVVQTMIDGLLKNSDRVSMYNFGTKKEGICFGCAAYHSLCELFPEVKEVEWDLSNYNSRRREFSKEIKTTVENMTDFEYAIDNLRCGNIDAYNIHAQELDMISLPIPDFKLPHLLDCDWKENIIHYQNYADSL